MSKRRRIFDIDIPEDEIIPAGKVEESAPEEKRRGPMATAITENAESLRERRDLESQIRAENDALAHEHVRLKKLGLITDLVPLDQIETYKLTRDRFKAADMELADLAASIKSIGLSNPIQVEPREDGKYELIQGYRRLSAYKVLLAETGDKDAYGAIPATILMAGETLDSLYRRMVDENLVRKDISFAEMAQLAIHYAMDPDTEEKDSDKAVAVLFKSTGYQKRSYVRSFIKLMSRLGDVLQHAPDIPRSLGLALVMQLEEVEGTAAAIKAELKDWENRSVQDELTVLRRYAGTETNKPIRAEKATVPAAKTESTGKAKTTFQIIRPQGRAKCTASSGKLEVRLPKDFSTIDRRRLEAAVRGMLDQLEG